MDATHNPLRTFPVRSFLVPFALFLLITSALLYPLSMFAAGPAVLSVGASKGTFPKKPTVSRPRQATVISPDKSLLASSVPSLIPRLPGSLATIAELSDTLGVQLAAQGQLLAAEPLLIRAKTAQPTVALYHLHYGIVEEALERNTAAQSAYQRAVQLDPTLLQATYNLGLLLDKQGKPLEGLPYLIKSLSLKPDSGLLHYDIGVLYAKLGRFNESAYHSRLALIQGKPFAEAYNNYGFALANLKRYPEALAMINKALVLKPGSAPTLDSKGFALFGMGEYPQAIVWYRKAIQADPTLPDLYLHLAEALEKAPVSLANNDVLTDTILAYETYLQLAHGDRTSAAYRSVQARLNQLKPRLAAMTPLKHTSAALSKSRLSQTPEGLLKQPLMLNALSNSQVNSGSTPFLYLNPGVVQRKAPGAGVGFRSLIPSTPLFDKP